MPQPEVRAFGQLLQTHQDLMVGVTWLATAHETLPHELRMLDEASHRVDYAGMIALPCGSFTSFKAAPYRIGAIGLRQPQYVHQRWHLTEDCQVLPGIREEIFR